MEFSEIILSRRKKLNKTLEDIAKDCDVSKATVLRWENGEIKNVRRDKISKLAKSLDVSPSYLMGWEKDNKKLNIANKETYTSFKNIDEAMEFIIKSPVVSAYGGYDLNKMSDEEIIDFANELSGIFKIIARKRQKK